MGEVDRRWPNRSKVSDGSIGDTSHAARKSDHNPDSSGDVLAVDITEDIARGPSLNAFWAEVIRRRDPRVKYLIYEGRIVTSYPAGGRPAWSPRSYTGVNAHKQHLHVSVHGHAKNDTSTWFAEVAEEDDMPYSEAQLTKIVRDAVQAELTTGGDQSRTAVLELVRRAVAAQLGYYGQREGEGPVMFILANHVKVPVTAPSKGWADDLRKQAGQEVQVQPVAVPAHAWDDMPTLGG
jgi:hypothetical protein